MIETLRDVMVLTKAEYERLPPDAWWEVVDGRAIAQPPPKRPHQELSDAIVGQLRAKLAASHCGSAISSVAVDIPKWPGTTGQFQRRVPDVVICRRKPEEYFEEGDPPEVVIEILSTRRGNVERTEKIDDYARAGVSEYWIVNPIDRVVEVYRLRGGEYALVDNAAQALRPEAFPGLEVDMREVWAVLD
jgi:Uma2 family endonuclease